MQIVKLLIETARTRENVPFEKFLNAKDESGDTALHRATWVTCSHDALNYLLGIKEVDVNTTNKEKRNALHAMLGEKRVTTRLKAARVN